MDPRFNNTFVLKKLVVLAAIAITTPVHAEQGDIFLAGKGGVMSINQLQAKPLYAVGLYGGYGLTRNLSIEAEANRGFVGGHYQDSTDSGTFRITTGAAYGSYRAPLLGDVYLKAKLGALTEMVENDAKTGKKTIVDIGISGGLGFGTQIESKLTLEGEYTVLEKNISYISLGAHLKF